MSLPSARPMVESGLCKARSTGAPSDGKKRIVAIPRRRLVLYPPNDNAGGIWRAAARGEGGRSSRFRLVRFTRPKLVRFTRPKPGRVLRVEWGKGAQMRKTASISQRWLFFGSSLAALITPCLAQAQAAHAERVQNEVFEDDLLNADLGAPFGAHVFPPHLPPART